MLKHFYLDVRRFSPQTVQQSIRLVYTYTSMPFCGFSSADQTLIKSSFIIINADNNFLWSVLTLQPQVCNIKMSSFSGVPVKDTKDHAKWAVTAAQGSYTTCIGDINRVVGYHSNVLETSTEW